ncbi:MAG: efflux RND transporter permease subunit [Paracoccaceae bacterium]
MNRVGGSFISGLISYFARHNTAANLILVLMVVFGLLAINKIRSQFFPDVVIEKVSIGVKWLGAGPEDIDDGIISLLEPPLLGIDGIEQIISSSTEGNARIYIDFMPGTDMSKAKEEVQTALDSVQNLPETADNPTIKRVSWRDRVTDVVISGPIELEQLGMLADEFTQKLYRSGISNTQIMGVSAPIIRVSVPSMNLIRYQVPLNRLAAAIAAEVDTDPTGEVGTSNRVRSGVSKRTIEEIGNILIRIPETQRELILSDLSKIYFDNKSKRREYYTNGNRAVVIRVDRSAESDAIKIQRTVETVTEQYAESLPKGIKIELSKTRADLISNRLEILLSNGLQGLGLVLILLFVFLSARTAFWVAAGIPAALLAAIAFMYVAGLTFNMISLFALIICLGIVVDDAIVVGEHADFRARRLGETPEEAAERGATRMALPVFTATITTIIAFAGLVAVGGRFGSLIADIPFTVIVVLLASLLECFLVLPNHMVHALRAKVSKNRWYDWPSDQFNKGFRIFREKLFRPFTYYVIQLRYLVLSASILLLAISSVLMISGKIKWRFFDSPERGGFTGNIAMLPAANRSDTKNMLDEMVRAIEKVSNDYSKEYDLNPLTFSISQIGGNSGRGISGAQNKDPDHLGSISVELIDADLRPYSSYAFLGAIQEEVVRHPLLETLSFRSWRSGPGGDSLSVDLLGFDPNRLKAASMYFQNQLIGLPEISGLEDTQAYDKNELILELTPRGVALGFDIDNIGKQLYQQLNGIEAVSFPFRNRSSKVIVEIPDSEVQADFLERVHVTSPKGNYIRLSDIVSVTSQFGFSSISRENGQRKITVTGSISEDDPSRAKEITDLIKFEILPDIKARFGVDTNLSGLFKQEKDFINDALIGFMLCLIGIYLALAWVFASWARPIVVMSIIPFGLIGTLWGHYFWGINLSLFSVVGLIGMTGIIINDSIVLVSTIDEYAQNRGLKPAILDAICDRLRPVLLTTLTTVLGLSPLLFETSKDAQFLKPTIVTLVYGLGFGMLIVLFLVPAIVVVQRDCLSLVKAFRRIIFGKRSPIVFRIAYSLIALILGLNVFFLCYIFSGIGENLFLESLLQEFGYKLILSIPIMLLLSFLILFLLLPSHFRKREVF